MPVPMASFESFERPQEKEYGGKKGGKRSFLQKAKRFGKQGKLGRGYQVDSETYSYFVRILELLKKDEFDTDEERELFVENSLSLTVENEVQLSSNQLVSRVIETLLPFTSEDVLYRFCQSFTPSLRVIVSDPFASHVLEKLLELTSADKWRTSEKLTEWFEKTSMFILNNFEDFTFETYSSFVMKKVLECLSGNVELPPEKDKQPMAVFKKSGLLVTVHGIRKFNPKWEDTLKEFTKRFLAWPQFNDLGQKPETARLLQNVLQSVSRTQKSQDIVKNFILRIIGSITAPLKPEDLAHRTLEVCLTVGDEKSYEKIFKEYYKGHLVEYCAGTPYTLQTIVSTAPNAKLIIFDELVSEMKLLIMNGKAVIIHHLAEQCNKFSTKQQELFESMKRSIRIMYGAESNVLLSLMAVGSRTESSDDGTVKASVNTSYFGTCTVEQLMDFSNPTGAEVIKCLTDMDTAKLRTLALDRKASFIISKFFKSWKVPEKEKVSLLKKLAEILVELSTTTFGSRIVDEIWLWADIQQKTIVAEELSQRIPLLAANKFARYMVENMGLNAYKRDKKEWVEHMKSLDKRKKIAEDIAAELGLKKTEVSSPSKVDADEAETPKKKSKKQRKSEVVDAEVDEAVEETPKKKKKSKKSKDGDITLNDSVSLDESVTKKKRKSEKHSKNDDSIAIEEDQPEMETPKKKKKKNRKSEAEALEADEAVDTSVIEDSETPSKKKKKKRSKSGDFTEADTSMEEVTPQKKKKRKSKSAEIEVEQETDTPKKKKSKKSKE